LSRMDDYSWITNHSWLTRQPRRFYLVVLPLLWGVIDFVNFYYPGDEYGGWAGSSLPGLWAAYFVNGHPGQAVPVVLLAGGLVMAAFGWFMDWLRVPWSAWYAVWLVAAGLLFCWSVSFYPTWDRAISKNGSIQAYILPALNLGLMFSSIACAFITAAVRGVARVVWAFRRW
jgi:hypothetical protein